MVTTLNMLLQMRRDNVFTSTYVLQPGEPGFEVSTNTLKIGDGTKTWAELDFANKALIDGLIAIVDQKVTDLGNVATDEEVEAIRKNLQDAVDALAERVKAVEDDLKEGGATYTKIANLDAKFADYKTAEAQKAIDDEQDRRIGLIETELETYGDIVTHNVSEFATAEQGAKADAAAVKADVDAALENITKDGGTIDSKISAFKTASVDPIAAAVEDITKDEGLLDQLEAAYIAADAVVAGNAATDATNKANAAQAAAEATAAADATAKADQALIDAKAYVDEEDKFEIDMNTINALGGIAAGSDLNNMTTHDILKKLLYPYVDASVGNATASPSNGGTVEVGSTQTITGVSISVTKKSEPITSIVLYNGSEELARKEGSSIANGTNTFSGLNVPVTATSATSTGKLKVAVTYPGSDGAAKTVNKETGAFTFVFPYYYGVCGAATALDANLISTLTKDIKGKGDKTYNYTTDAQRMVIAYPKSHNTLKLVKDGNGLDNTGAFGSPVTVSFTNEYGVTADYYIYANGVTTGTAKMTFTHN